MLPLLVASCIGEGWYTRLWGCAPFSKRISVHATLPTVQALNRGVTPSIVKALTCKHIFLALSFRPRLTWQIWTALKLLKGMYLHNHILHSEWVSYICSCVDECSGTGNMVSNTGLMKGCHMVYCQNIYTVTLDTDTEIRGITSDMK